MPLETRKRLTDLIALLRRSYPDGISTPEIAQELGVTRQTAFKDVHRLLEDGVPVVVEKNRYFIRPDYGRAIHLTAAQAWLLYLPLRRLVRAQLHRNPLVRGLLRKVTELLRDEMADELDPTGVAVDPKADEVFETLVDCWKDSRLVEITYQALNASRESELVVEPWWFEPAVWTDAFYLVCGRKRKDGSRETLTLKIDRIRTARKLLGTFERPAPKTLTREIEQTWGIWMGEPVRVRLHFNPRVRDRLRETRWHPSETMREEADGAVIWEALVSQPREVLPWIRGWGADVEVLEPKELREALEEEIKKMTRLYRIGDGKPINGLIAHRREDGSEQSLIAHLTETSHLAEHFAAKVGLPEVGKIMGLLHDFGKASKEYQDYLRSAEGLINPDEDDYVDYRAKKGKIDHSTAGAQLVHEKLAGRGQESKILAQFLALALASHHSGLIDCLKPDGTDDFSRRITKEDKDTHLGEARSKLPEIEKQLDEILSRPIDEQFYQIVFESMTEAADSSKQTRWFKRGLLARFLLSCLLDADRLNTADFEHPGNEAIRHYGQYSPWEILIDRLESKFDEYAQKTAQMPVGRALEVNQLRAQVAQACLDFAKKPRGIYQLTVPTGGGKTLASLRFALHHAKEHKMERVFYIVPYITIIDQNAKTVREVLEDVDENGNPLDEIVLEHHSNFVPPDDTRRRHNLLAENWDAPIVFTTQVQFLEALFGAGTRDARRMHQLANSVIIFDEVQTIPIRITHMFTTALRFLVHDCGSTVVLCTATQPPFDRLDNPYRELKIALEQHIIQDEPELFRKLKRVEVHDERKPGGMSNTEIVELSERALDEKGSVLIVVNTRASALSLYQQIKAQNLGVETYHLSTNMCPAHRMDVLENKIKPKLKAKEPVVCVSTQLIEAGVDIDFGAVIRALAGLDSIAQSAGRCNRHGERDELGSVWVTNPQEEKLDQLQDIKAGREHARRVLDDFKENSKLFGDDRIGLDAVATYYEHYYRSRNNEMDYSVFPNSSVSRNDDLFNLLSTNELSLKAYQAMHHASPDILLRQSFRTASGEFRVIDSLTRGVVVPYKEGKQIIIELCSAFGLEKRGKLLKQAQRYSVNLYEHQFRKLLEAGGIREVQEGAEVYYLDTQYYSEAFGWSDEPINSMDLLVK